MPEDLTLLRNYLDIKLHLELLIRLGPDKVYEQLQVCSFIYLMWPGGYELSMVNNNALL